MLTLWTLGGLGLGPDPAPPGGVAGQPHRLALLAFLARAPAMGVSRDRILATFWPEKDGVRGRGALRQALYALRRELGSELVLGTWEIRLNPAMITADVWWLEGAFKQGDLERVSELYQGPFLDGFHMAGVPEFTRWMERERARLAERHAAALEGLAVAAARRGDWEAAAGTWRCRAREDPLDARVVRELMLALDRSGNRCEALRWAEAHGRQARLELDAPADPAVQALADRLRR